MKNRFNSSNSRIGLYRLILIIVAIIIVIRLVNLQIINGNEYYNIVNEVNVRNVSIDGQRGWIFDRNGVALAKNIRAYDVNLYYRSQNIDSFNQSLLKLYEILENNNEEVISDLNKYLNINPVSFGRLIDEDEVAREKWLREMIVQEGDLDNLKTANDVFEYFIEEKFKIDDTYSDLEAYKIMEIRYNILIKGYSSITPVKISKQVGFNTMSEIETRKDEIKGIATEEVYLREYTESKYFSNITGFIRSIDPEEYEELKNQEYDMNELIGKDSLEKSYEKYLRAYDGEKTAILKRGDYNVEYNVSIEPEDGYDVYSTTNYEIQKAGYDSLEKNINKIASNKDGITNFGDAKVGSAIMMDVNNGDILAMVSYPSYDANVLVSNDDLEIEKLENDEKKLFFNRPIQGLYPAASTFKPITAIASLEEGIIEPNEKILDEGVINIDGMDFYSLEYRRNGTSYGEINLKEALKYSANVFFYKIGMQTGIDKLDYWASQFGLGKRTGIDIEGEEEGQRNNYEAILKYEPDRYWGNADTAQASIGQLYNQFTPIQLVRYTAALANGGKLIKPRLVSAVKKKDGSLISEIESDVTIIDVEDENINAVNEGMLAVANAIDGTAVEILDDFPYGRVAAKTGTAETGLEDQGVSSHGLLICYAPYEEPEVAVCVVIENGVWGYNAVPVAYDMLISYFENKE